MPASALARLCEFQRHVVSIGVASRKRKIGKSWEFVDAASGIRRHLAQREVLVAHVAHCRCELVIGAARIIHDGDEGRDQRRKGRLQRAHVGRRLEAAEDRIHRCEGRLVKMLSQVLQMSLCSDKIVVAPLHDDAHDGDAVNMSVVEGKQRPRLREHARRLHEQQVLGASDPLEVLAQILNARPRYS